MTEEQKTNNKGTLIIVCVMLLLMILVSVLIYVDSENREELDKEYKLFCESKNLIYLEYSIRLNELTCLKDRREKIIFYGESTDFGEIK